MTIRSKIAQVALAAVVLGAGFSAQAGTYEEKLLAKPIPKLFLIDVDTHDCRDLEDTQGLVGSFQSRCSGLMDAMPLQRRMPIVKNRVHNVLFPKSLDENGKRTGPRVQRVASLDEKAFYRLNDYQITFLAYQLGVQVD